MPQHILTSLVVLCLLLRGTASGQSGHLVSGVGPVNLSMGGAGVGLPLDALGALHWNPASISGLPASEASISFEIFRPDVSIRSSVGPSAFGPGVPAATLGGKTRSNDGTVIIPSLGFVRRSLDSPWTFGLGVLSIGGFGVDYDGSANNPILSPQPPGGVGFGAVSSSLELGQIVPTASYGFGDGWSVGFAPSLAWAKLEVTPFSGAAPDDANGDGFPTYPAVSRGARSTGWGWQVGLYREPRDGWSLGLSYKAVQRFNRFRFDAVDELGAPRRFDFALDSPPVVSAGVGYTGWEDWALAADVRWIGYGNTRGFDKSGFAADGSVRGFGWDNIWLVALGAQRQLTDTLTARCGVSLNESPIGGDVIFFNTPSPAIIRRHVSAGLTWRSETDVSWNLTWYRGLGESVSGPWHGPGGPIAGTEVKSSLSTRSITLGCSTRF